MAEVTTMSREDAIELVIDTEFPSVLIEDIEFLSRKVKQGLSFEAALQALIACRGLVAPEEESVLAAAHERLRELEGRTDDAVQDVARSIELNKQAEENERLLLEHRKLFDAPAMAADFEHYKLLAFWDMHEATCLLLGKDPRKRRTEPARLVPWALGQGIDVPEVLATAFRRPESELRLGLSDDDLESSIVASGGSSTGGKTAMWCADLEQKVKDLEVKLKTEKSANSNWRNTTLLIMYGLLHAKLGSTPRDKPASVSEVVNFLGQVLNRSLTEILSGRA